MEQRRCGRVKGIVQSRQVSVILASFDHFLLVDVGLWCAAQGRALLCVPARNDEQRKGKSVLVSAARETVIKPGTCEDRVIISQT